MEKTWSSAIKIKKNKTEMFTFPSSLQYTSWNTSQSNKKRKKPKKKIEKEWVKLSILAEGEWYKVPKILTENLQIKSNFTKWKDIKPTDKKPVTFLHSNNKHTEEDHEYTTIYNSTKENNVYRNETNQGDEVPFNEKCKTPRKRLRSAIENVMVSYAPAPVELIL